jgi:hypothetical protein
MALHTLRRRSSKNALQMAPLAHDLRVTAAEREAGAAVIDLNVRADTSLGRRGIRHQQHRAAYRQKPGNNGPGKEPTSSPAGQLSHFCIRLVSAIVEPQSITPAISAFVSTALVVPLMENIWERNPKHGYRKGHAFKVKHRKLMIYLRSLYPAWVDLPVDAELLLYKSEGQHLRSLQWVSCPQVTNVRNHTRIVH